MLACFFLYFNRDVSKLYCGVWFKIGILLTSQGDFLVAQMVKSLLYPHSSESGWHRWALNKSLVNK